MRKRGRKEKEGREKDMYVVHKNLLISFRIFSMVLIVLVSRVLWESSAKLILMIASSKLHALMEEPAMTCPMTTSVNALMSMR